MKVWILSPLISAPKSSSIYEQWTYMFSHSGVVSQSECIHNWSMWDWQSRNSCNIKSVGDGPVNLFTLPRPLSNSKPTHLEISPNEMCSTLIRWDTFWGDCVSNRVCLSCYIHNLTSRLVGNFRETVSCLPIWYVPIYKWDLCWNRWIMICQEEGSADYLLISLFFCLCLV